MIGVTIGSYEIAERIGSGGVGEVYRATDHLLKRSVAIKFLRPELAERTEVVERFHGEARALAQLVHPNVALLYCLLREGPRLAMVMEYVEGRTLAQLLHASGRLAPDFALPLVHQALDGIGHAHEAGIVHRDIKPSNLMLATNGAVKVMDFGIARCLGTDRTTRHGHMIGTVHYMSPEQVRGGETDARSDIYAMGVLIYELLTGKLPFDDESEFELARAHIEQPPRPLREHVPELPEALDTAVLRALEKEPEVRYASTLELSDALAAAAPLALDAPDAPPAQAPTRGTRGTASGARRRTSRTPLVAAMPTPTEPSSVAGTRVLDGSDSILAIEPDRRVARRLFAAAAAVVLSFVALGGVLVVRQRAEAAATTLREVPRATPAIAGRLEEDPPPAPKLAAHEPGARKAAPAKPLRSAPEPAEDSSNGGDGWVVRRR